MRSAMRRSRIRCTVWFAFPFDCAAAPVKAVKPQRLLKIRCELVHLSEHSLRISIQSGNEKLDDHPQSRTKLNLLAHNRWQATGPYLDTAPGARPITHLP